jgi:methylmalonyl-CoA mutase
MDNSTNLFEDFPAVSRDEWEKLINNESGGKATPEKLIWNTTDRLQVPPFFFKGEITQNPALLVNRGWKVRERITDNNLAEARNHIIRALKADTDILEICTHYNHTTQTIRAVPIQSLNDLAELFSGLDLTGIEILFNGGIASPFFIYAFHSVTEMQKADSVTVLFDPFTIAAKDGALPEDLKTLPDLFNSAIQTTDARILGIDTVYYHNCGASAAQQTGLLLAIANQYCNILSDHHDINTLFNRMNATMASGPHYFPEIAKFRAVRILWDQFTREWGGEGTLPLHAETSGWNKSVLDPHVNMLRATTEAMSAVIGGATSLCVNPFDETFAHTTSFSERIARNVNHILKHEAHLHRVADPSAGSWYIDYLTNEIAEQGWDFFRAVESEGGFISALESGFIQREIYDSQKIKKQAFTSGKMTLVGVNRFANTDETVASKKNHEGVKADSGSGAITFKTLKKDINNGASLADTVQLWYKPESHIITPLTPLHIASGFEELRRAVQVYNEKNKRPLSATLILTGDPRMRKTRASFSYNFLTAAGIKVDEADTKSTLSETANSLELQPDIVVLCAADEDYPDSVPTFCEAFPKSIRILAGNPGEHSNRFSESGINFFIHAKADILSTLKDICKVAGVKG